MTNSNTQPVAAMPHPMSEEDVVREHQDSLARVVDEHDAHLHGEHAEHGQDDANGGYFLDHAATAPGEPRSRKESIFLAVQAIRDAERCDVCGKTKALINWGRGFRPEKPTPATHCACPGGPAYAGIGGTL